MKKILKNLQFNSPFSLFLRKKVLVFSVLAVPLGTGAGVGVLLEDRDAGAPYIENVALVEPSESVIIHFPRSVKVGTYRQNIRIMPQTKARATWNDDFTILTFTPQSAWAVATQYTIHLPEGKMKGGTKLSEEAYSFETITPPMIADVSPHDGQKDVYAGKNMPLAVKFDRSIGDFSLEFVLTPKTSVSYRYNPEEKTAYIFPHEELTRDTTYTLTTFAKHKSDTSDIYAPLKHISFRTLPDNPDAWPQDLVARTALAQRLTTPRVVKGKYIDVNLKAQITTLFDDGEAVAMYPASSGRRETPTPTGEFTIYNKHPYALSRMFQSYLPYWMAFTSDGKYGFHDLPEWPVGHPEVPSGGKESLASIGVQASPGCVRHNSKDSKSIYDWTEIGTKVIIY